MSPVDTELFSRLLLCEFGQFCGEFVQNVFKVRAQSWRWPSRPHSYWRACADVPLPRLVSASLSPVLVTRTRGLPALLIFLKEMPSGFVGSSPPRFSSQLL